MSRYLYGVVRTINAIKGEPWHMTRKFRVGITSATAKVRDARAFHR
jgi:hypothetical protein